MATAKETVKFFTHGSCDQYEQVLKMYPQALKLKADRKAKKPEELIKLDDWYQNELPKKIKARGKDAHMIHEELVQTMKWKQIRGKFYPQLSYLVKVNTPRMVIQETKKAFRKLPNLEQAITALGNLKGVGTTMASALLAAACPESAPFMADECLMAIPDVEGIDYTTKEYLKFAQHIDSVAQRLNLDAEQMGSSMRWSPHKVELALWTHYVVSELKPELLDGIQIENGTTSIPPALAALHQNGDSLDADATITSDESNSAGGVPPINGKGTALTTGELDDDTSDVTGAFVKTNKGFPAPVNGKAKVGSALSAAVLDEDTRDATASFTDTENGSPTVDDLCENSASTSSVSESTKDSIQDEDSNSSPYTGKRSFNNTSTMNGPPAAKKVRTEAK